MLSELYIENIAVIERVSLEFDSGFNVFTGETGAGKSILIDAINAVLGNRTSKDIIRTGAQKAKIIASFNHVSEKSLLWLEENGYEIGDGEPVILHRELWADGKNNSRINGQPAQLSALKELGECLINIHGQHDNQALASAKGHIHFIDDYANLQIELSEYRECYHTYKALKEEYDQLISSESDKQDQIDLLSYQINEIESVSPNEEEEQELISERELYRNSERILTALNKAHVALAGTDENDGAIYYADVAAAELLSLPRGFDNFEESAQALGDIKEQLFDLSSTIQNYLDDLDFDPKKQDQIEQRLDDLYKLKHKYGASIDEVLVFCVNARQKLSTIEGASERIAQLEVQLKQAHSQMAKSADQLTNKRLEATERMCSLVKEELAFLDMPNAILTGQHQIVSYRENGQDEIELLMSVNLGETPKPLAKIASGGELSRIMLAIKNVTAQSDTVSTMIFDEIDTGVSGRTAMKIAKMLLSISKDKQVICVTHLAQIAAAGQLHMLIEKTTDGNRTFTNVTPLNGHSRLEELARILGGEMISQSTLQNAAELIEFYIDK